MFFDHGVDRRWVKKVVAEEWKKKLAEEKSWPTETDCDKLNRGFVALNEAGILALHNAGVTPSDGMCDVADLYAQRGKERSGLRGYCYYHSQEVESALAGNGLYLLFGQMAGGGQGIEVGQEIQRTLENAGLTVVWDGTLDSCIKVAPFKWQRRCKDATRKR